MLSATVFAAPRYMVAPAGGADPDLVAQAAGLTILERYDSAVWVEGPANLSLPNAFVKEYPDWDLIRTVEPFRIGDRPGEPEAAKRGLYLVHFRAPIRSEWAAALRAVPGLTVIQAFPNLAMVVHLANVPASLGNLPGVDWVGFLEPSFRISPYVARVSPETTGDATLMLVNTTGLETTLDRLAQLGVTVNL
jgi:hypothetical protein